MALINNKETYKIKNLSGRGKHIVMVLNQSQSMKV